jgi:predicted MFS family arabinose efflux permease
MSTVRETVDELRGGGRGWTLLAIAVGWLLLSGFRVVLPALLPQIKADFAVDNASAGFALTVLWLVYAGLQFPSGVVADRTGERTLLIVGTLLAALSLGLFAVAPLFSLFLLACGLFGLGAGLFGTPRDMLLSRTYPTADVTA